MWRKTRSGPYSQGGWFGQTCYGVDPNRNWDDHWDTGGHVSSDPCDDEYVGPKANSEVEVNHNLLIVWLNINWITFQIRNMQAYLKKIPNLNAYFNLHSYSQDWLTLFAYAKVFPSDNQELVKKQKFNRNYYNRNVFQMDVANRGAAALKAVHGTEYTVGSPPSILCMM